jgi:chemotaxis protein CheZ
MPVRQKTFRIEQTNPSREPPSLPPEGAGSALQHQVLNELKALRDLIEQRPPAVAARIESESTSKCDRVSVSALNTLRSETDSIHRAISHTMQELMSLHFGAFSDAGAGRASRELDAVVTGTERATQQILEATEAIDEAANTLSASLKHAQDQAHAADIRDHVVRIFEACNFQDLSGQRIAKVLATLTFVEDRVVRMLEIWGGRDTLEDFADAARTAIDHEPKLAAGPKLDGDAGHVTQQEIDAMFA